MSGFTLCPGLTIGADNAYQIATFLLRSSRTGKGDMAWALGRLLSETGAGASGSIPPHGVSSDILVVGCFAPRGSMLL